MMMSARKSGFTLIELLVVISIIALLSSVVLASLNAARDKARLAAGMRFAQSSHGALGADAVAVYAFDEGAGSTATDLSLNGNDGTISGAAYSSSTYGGSASRYALSFDGVNDYVQVPHNDSQLLTNGFTITAWINPLSSGEGSFARIVDKTEDSSAGNGFLFNLSSERLRALVSNGGVRESAAGSIKFDGTWKHVAVSIQSDGAVTFYVNGAQSGTPATTGAPSGIVTTNPLCIGNRSSASTCATDRTFDGLIDDVRIYSRAFTAAEVGKLYAESAPKYRLADAE